MTDTWYVLEDGSKADPADVVADDNGTLRHKSGVAVAMRGDVPRTSGAGPARETVAAADREMKPAATGKGYRTRGAKAE